MFSHWIVRFEVLAHLEGDGAVGGRRPRPKQLDLFQVVFVHLRYNIRSVAVITGLANEENGQIVQFKLLALP